MQCPSCGHRVPEEESRFCPSCGCALASSSPAKPPDPIAAIDGAVDAFEEGELQHALDALDEELDRAEQARDEITLIYLLDVSRQMVAQLEEGEFDNLEQLAADTEEALHAVQEGALSATLESARERFAQGDHPQALELLYRELSESPVADEEPARLAVWRVLAVAADMADALSDEDARPFEQVRLSAERRLKFASASANGQQAGQSEYHDHRPSPPMKGAFMSNEGEVREQELDEVEQESILEPFDTPNPWLQKLFGMADYGKAPTVAIGLLSEVSPDRDERLLAAVKCEHGRLRRGYLLATTKALRWIRTFPSRAQDSWGYDYKLDYKGISITKAVLILGTGDQFQTYRTRAKPFAAMYNVIQEAMAWEAAHANEMVLDAVATPAAPSASLAEELQKLAALHEQGILTSEEFASAKQRLVG